MTLNPLQIGQTKSALYLMDTISYISNSMNLLNQEVACEKDTKSCDSIWNGSDPLEENLPKYMSKDNLRLLQTIFVDDHLDVNNSDVYQEIADKLLTDPASNNDLEQVLSSVRNSAISEKAKRQIISALYLIDAVTYAAYNMAALSSEPQCSDKSTDCDAIWSGDYPDQQIPGKLQPSASTLVTLFKLAQKPEELDKLIEGIDTSVLNDPSSNMDLIAALCLIDFNAGYCSFVSSIDPAQFPANTETQVKISGANLPTRGKVEVVQKPDDTTAVCTSKIFYGSDTTGPTAAEIYATLLVPAPGNYYVRVSDQSGRLSAFIPITVVDSKETTASMIVAPDSFRPNETENVSATATNIDAKNVSNGALLELDIVDGSGNSVLSNGAVALTNKQARLNIDDGLISLGDATGSDKNRAVSIKVKKGTAVGEYTLVLRVKGAKDPFVSCKVNVADDKNGTEKENEEEKPWKTWSREHFDPQFTLRVNAPIYDPDATPSNPLAASGLEREQDPFNVGLRLEPQFNGKSVSLTGEAHVEASSTQLNTGLEPELKINAGKGFSPMLSVGYQYTNDYLDTPSLALPFDSQHELTASAGLAYEAGIFSAEAYYRYLHNWFTYENSVLGSGFDGSLSQHEVGGQLQVKGSKGRLTLTGSHRTGTTDMPDILDGPQEKDINSGNISLSGQLYTTELRPFFDLGYSSGHGMGNNEQFAFYAKLGLNAGSFWIANRNYLSLLYSYENDNSWLNMKTYSLGLEWDSRNLLKFGAKYSYIDMDSPIHYGLLYLDLGPAFSSLIFGPKGLDEEE